MKVTCPKCKKGQLWQHVNVFVKAPYGRRKLDKKGIRASDVEVMGVGWDTALVFCDRAGCGYMMKHGGRA